MHNENLGIGLDHPPEIDLQDILGRLESVSQKFEGAAAEAHSFWPRISAFLDLAAAVSRMSDLKEIARFLLRKSLLGTGSKVGTVMFREPEGEKLRILAAEGWTPNMIGSIDPEETLAGGVIRSGESLIVADPVDCRDLSRHADAHRYSSSSFAIAPIRLGKETIGAVCLTGKPDGLPYTREDALFVDSLIRQIEGPLQNAITLEQARFADREKEETLKRQRLQITQAQEQILRAEKLTSLGQMVSGVAHELNNPVTAILGFAELLLDEELPENSRDKVHILLSEAQRARQILQNLLAFLRYRDPEKKSVDLNSVVETIVALRRYELSRHDIDLSTDLDPDLPLALLDVDQIQLLLLNLVNNSAQAMPPKGRRQIRIGTRAGKNSVQFWVSDTGVGIPISIQDRVFEPFFSTKPGNAGSGLGLALSKDIVANHNGEIRLRSREGTGTRIVVEIPLVEAAAIGAVSCEQPPRALPPGDRRTAIVIEDEVHNAELVREILSAAGFEVTLSLSGIEALQVLLHENFDLIVCDLLMPELDGKRLYREIEKYRPNLCGKFVFTTGDTADPQTHLFVKNNKLTLVAKPFTRYELLEAAFARLEKEAGDPPLAQASTG